MFHLNVEFSIERVFSDSVASARRYPSRGNVSDIHILGSQTPPTEAKTVGLGPSSLNYNKPPDAGEPLPSAVNSQERKDTDGESNLTLQCFSKVMN